MPFFMSSSWKTVEQSRFKQLQFEQLTLTQIDYCNEIVTWKCISFPATMSWLLWLTFRVPFFEISQLEKNPLQREFQNFSGFLISAKCLLCPTISARRTSKLDKIGITSKNVEAMFGNWKKIISRCFSNHYHLKQRHLDLVQKKYLLNVFQPFTMSTSYTNKFKLNKPSVTNMLLHLSTCDVKFEESYNI
jgi:hypothetical protein